MRSSDLSNNALTGTVPTERAASFVADPLDRLNNVIKFDNNQFLHPTFPTEFLSLSAPLYQLYVSHS